MNAEHSYYNIPMAATANPNLQDTLNPPPPMEGGLSNAAHPIACIFTFLFKAAAFLVYPFVYAATSYWAISSAKSIPSSSWCSSAHLTSGQ